MWVSVWHTDTERAAQGICTQNQILILKQLSKGLLQSKDLLSKYILKLKLFPKPNLCWSEVDCADSAPISPSPLKCKLVDSHLLSSALSTHAHSYVRHDLPKVFLITSYVLRALLSDVAAYYQLVKADVLGINHYEGVELLVSCLGKRKRDRRYPKKTNYIH